jgi:hypothetical protein
MRGFIALSILVILCLTPGVVQWLYPLPLYVTLPVGFVVGLCAGALSYRIYHGEKL